MTQYADLLEMISLTKFAQMLGVDVSSCHRWRTRGISGRKLPCTKIGGRWYVHQRDIEEFVAATTTAAAGGRKPDQAKPTRQVEATAAKKAGLKLDAVVFGRSTGQRQDKQASK